MKLEKRLDVNNRSLKLKIICNLPALAVHAYLANPSEKLGERGSLRIIEITEIPDGVEDSQVLNAWTLTSDASYLGHDGEYPRHSYAFSEIGNGRILRQ